MTETVKMPGWEVRGGANSHCFELRVLDETGKCIAFTDEEHAHLIAASLELLEALRDCLNRFVEAFPAASEYEPIKRGLAAIAKAEGLS